jgi:tetrahydromethanopterin S-methyltransferase subunit G
MDEKYIQMIIENKDSCKSAHHRLDKLETDIGEIKELTIAVKEIAMETKANREDVNKMNERLENIEQKPAKNWDKVITTIIGTVVGAIAGGIIGLILK